MFTCGMAVRCAGVTGVVTAVGEVCRDGRMVPQVIARFPNYAGMVRFTGNDVYRIEDVDE